MVKSVLESSNYNNNQKLKIINAFYINVVMNCRNILCLKLFSITGLLQGLIRLITLYLNQVLALFVDFIKSVKMINLTLYL